MLGPQQVETKIDQDRYLSQQLSLWDQRGSRVIRGNVLALPIGDTLLYVEPIYLQAETAAYPELRLVVLMHGDDLAYGNSLEEALARLVGETVDLPEPTLSLSRRRRRRGPSGRRGRDGSRARRRPSRGAAVAAPLESLSESDRSWPGRPTRPSSATSSSSRSAGSPRRPGSSSAWARSSNGWRATSRPSPRAPAHSRPSGTASGPSGRAGPGTGRSPGSCRRSPGRPPSAGSPCTRTGAG